MAKNAEYSPTSDVLKTLIEKGIEPVLERLERETGQSLPAELVVYCGEMPGPRVAIMRSIDTNGSRGEIRLRVRQSAIEGRSLFRAQGAFSGALGASGISGFLLGGAVRNNGDLKARPLVVLHNHTTWLDWW